MIPASGPDLTSCRPSRGPAPPLSPRSLIGAVDWTTGSTLRGGDTIWGRRGAGDANFTGPMCAGADSRARSGGDGMEPGIAEHVAKSSPTVCRTSYYVLHTVDIAYNRFQIASKISVTPVCLYVSSECPNSLDARL